MSTHVLEIDPETELKFSLNHAEASPRTVLILKHAGTTAEHIAFKVKTTQPRRYLVRPNQGLIAPGKSETINILLVEKDKQILMQSYDRLGQSGLDHSKDKFLVQSCAVGPSFVAKSSGTELYDSLTSMWNSVTSGGASSPVFNKKLHVRHIVTDNKSKSIASPPSKLETVSNSNMEKMPKEQLVSELSGLRKKYDELVGFSVNLTAERDILSNTLEQTKRDVNREMAARSALENKQGGGAAGAVGSSGSLKSTLIRLVLIALVCFIFGLRTGAEGRAGNVPLIGRFFAPKHPPQAEKRTLSQPFKNEASPEL